MFNEIQVGYCWTNLDKPVFKKSNPYFNSCKSESSQEITVKDNSPRFCADHSNFTLGQRLSCSKTVNKKSETAKHTGFSFFGKRLFIIFAKTLFLQNLEFLQNSEFI